MATTLHSFPAWQRLPDTVRDGLDRAGITEPVVVRGLFDGSEQEVDSILEEIGCDVHFAGVLVELWEGTALPAKRKLRALSKISVIEASVRGVLRERERKHAQLNLLTGSGSREVFAHTSDKFKVRKWPTRLRRPMAKASGPKAREEAENQERARWISELRALLGCSVYPIVAIASDLKDPEAVWSCVGQGLRARTLRRRVKDWHRALLHGFPFPRKLSDVLEYIQSLAEGGAP